jgi:hypothetical protein
MGGAPEARPFLRSAVARRVIVATRRDWNRLNGLK